MHDPGEKANPFKGFDLHVQGSRTSSEPPPRLPWAKRLYFRLLWRITVPRRYRRLIKEPVQPEQ